MLKRLLLVVFLALVVIPLHSQTFVQSFVESVIFPTLDSALHPQTIKVTIEDEPVVVNIKGISNIKKSFAKHNFSSLEFEERLELYNRLRLKSTWPAFKNLLIGFGSGSKIQHDTTSVLVGSLLDWSSAAVIGVGAAIWLVDAFAQNLFSQTSTITNTESNQIAQDLMVGGLIALGVSRVIQFILPFTYSPRYNKTLRDGLGLTKDLNDSLSFDIALNFNEMNNVQLVASLSF